MVGRENRKIVEKCVPVVQPVDGQHRGTLDSWRHGVRWRLSYGMEHRTSNLAGCSAMYFDSYRCVGGICWLNLQGPQQFHEELVLDYSRALQTLTLRNLGPYIPNDTASYSRIQLRDPQISQETVLFPHSLQAALSPELQRTPYRRFSARLVNCTNHTLPRCHGTHPRHTATPIVPIFSRRARWPHGSLGMRSSTRLHDARS